MDSTGRNRSGFQLAGTVSGQAAFDKPSRPAALRRGEAAEENETEGKEETELNRVEEDRERMSDETEGETDDEGEIAVPDWKVRAGPRSKPTQRERRARSNKRAIP